MPRWDRVSGYGKIVRGAAEDGWWAAEDKLERHAALSCEMLVPTRWKRRGFCKEEVGVRGTRYM